MPLHRPRICLVVPSLEQGGGVPSVAEFVCQAIEQSGRYDIRLISLSPTARDNIGIALSKPGSWFSGMRTDSGFWRGRPFLRVGAFASELEFQRYQPRKVLTDLVADCDLIQVVCGSPAWAWSVCGLGKPVAVQCATRAIVERRRQEAMAHGARAIWRRWMTKLTDQLERRAFQAVDAIQVENTWMLDYARELNVGREVIIAYAPPGVNAARFRPATVRERQSLLSILCVGRLDDPRKNICLLLEAFGTLPNALKSNTRLVLAGSAKLGPDFWVRAEQLKVVGQVDFVHSPDTESLIRLYQSATVFALPSDEEGLGVVILEAMACGVPVVSTRSGGPDGIITDGVDGFLVALDDEKAMAERLTCLLTDAALNERMGIAAREKIMRKYEAGIAGKAFLDIYERLLFRPSASGEMVK